MEVRIRRATRDDAEAISEYAKKLVLQHQAYDNTRFAWLAGHANMARFYGAQADKKDAALLVAEIDSKVVGFAYLQFEAENYVELLSKAAWIHDLYVDETARGAGAGKLLLGEAIKTAKDLGANKVMLTVAAQNQAAQSLFAQLGFQTTMHEMMLDLSNETDSQK